MKEKSLINYKELLEDEDLLIDYNIIDEEIFVKGIAYNSLELEEGMLFICKGANFKIEYLIDALKKGACGYISTTKYDLDKIQAELKRPVNYFIVSDIRKTISKVSSLYFDKIWNDNLNIIGITGTKGKSTTASFIKSILDVETGYETGFSSGIYTYDGKTKEKSKKLTTPETIELHKILNNCVQNNCKYLTMEVSSQGLKYHRVLDLDYKVGVFLNLSEDHISSVEHKDMEDYFTSKLKIFEHSKIAVINLDMDERYLDRVIEKAQTCERVITFGTNKGDICGLSVTEFPSYIQLKCSVFGQTKEYKVNIGGSYNGQNALASIAVCYALGISDESIAKGLEKVRVQGRMEMYNIVADSFDVIVDCAHNKISYEAIFNYVRKHFPDRKIGFLFGCVGDKALNRRREAGEIADKNADLIFITERDPGKEDVYKICNEILQHIKDKSKAQIIVDRDVAVETALSTCESLGNTVLILAGCGSDAYVKRGNKLILFDTDGQRVERYINNKKGDI